ncbi:MULTISPECIES: ABC transporter ATP-binding protein [Syntrophotalea]|jgi:ABC-type Fe3+/spermidine/putrescine transport system ATPase subunit|uniref:ABC transporter domain-containing protein n=1 Tax=Syntrophotalea acetylenica TaxID=29542 RepID=A0A1L3GI43_SYNAC|nr:ABC transporter ATP-binding protein [Syntrophotalea acetylenica]APG25545.1 hypothetical protein A7E75_11340 [Syntrophotalea acetylenica]APG43612.1 hypothetical protein A6070_05355 [Syntrophotalea acetylenica]
MIEIRNLSGNLGGFCLKDINLTINDGEYMVLLGPTGAGKTVLIEYLVGMYRQTEGSILVDGEDITPLYTEERNIAYVPQDYALFPNLTVEKNIAYGLEAKGLPQHEIVQIRDEIISSLGIEYIRQRMPLNLSGGEKQRVALGRALATQPSVVLLDEPLSALDENLRATMSKELQALQRKTNATFVHVCHNFEEAASVADRIAIMNNGHLIQVDTLENLKTRPLNEFIVRFLKTQNIFPGVSDGLSIGINEVSLKKPSPFQGNVKIAIRPEHVYLGPPNDGEKENSFAGRIAQVSYKPHLVEYGVDIGMPLIAFHIGREKYRVGDLVTVHIPQEHIILVELESSC